MTTADRTRRQATANHAPDRTIPASPDRRAQMSTDLLEQTDTTIVTDDGDHDLMSHYATKKDIERSMFEGVEIVALCGKKWRPSRDFTKYPICKTCEEMLRDIPE